MNLLDLYEEVIEGHILPLLDWNDLLRFRRVCNTTHDITTRYMKVHPERAPEIEIAEEGNRSLNAFMEMGIPTTKLFLDTEASGYRFYENNAKDLDRFLEEYGTLVKSLRVKELTLLIHGKERKFLEGLVNLENLEADYLGAGTGTKAVSEQDFDNALAECMKLAQQNPNHVRGGLPLVLSPLKKFQLKIGQKKRFPIPNVIICLQGFLGSCHGLEYLSLPFNSLLEPHHELHEAYGDPSQALALAFHYLRCALTASFSTYQKVNVKFVDFASFHDELYESNGPEMVLKASLHFMKLCEFCLQTDVKLLNVGPSWFLLRRMSDLPPELACAELGKVVLSLVNIMPFVFDLEMPNLERIDIRNTSQSMTVLLDGQTRPSWPSLKSLDVNVDSKVVVAQLGIGVGINFETRHLFNFLFKDISRLALVELCLRFKEGEEELAIPKTEDIVSSCPNLKKLTIVNWPGTNKALIKLWNGLPGLEEISLENCKQLGNVAFVGENSQNPVFLKLKNLKKLSLKGLDQMPKITDTLLNLVIRHLKLTHLILTSNRPVKSVTMAGVETLLSGPFKDSIEKFPFCSWSLENVTSAEFKATEKKFRSYNMI